MFLGITMYCARLRVIFALSVRRRLWLWEGPKNTIMLQNINYFTIIYTFGGYWENKNRTIEKKNSEGRRGDSGWSGSVVFWLSAAPSQHRTNMAGQKASLQANNGRALQDIAKQGYTWKSPRGKNWDIVSFQSSLREWSGIQVRFVEQFGGPNHRNGPKLRR